jgi:hypothetical protein
VFTIRVTDEQITNWCHTGPDCKCPLAAAFKAHLESLGTPVDDILNASYKNGAIVYKVGDVWYKAYLEPHDCQPAVKFIDTVDFTSEMPRKRVFHYTTPMRLY